jgi:hypothetical protein
VHPLVKGMPVVVAFRAHGQQTRAQLLGAEQRSRRI